MLFKTMNRFSRVITGVPCRAFLLFSLGTARLVASSYDYAYGSMAHYNERSRENALARASNYSPNSTSSSSVATAFDSYIAQRRESDRREEQRQNEQRRNDQRNAGTGNTILDNFNKYKRLHPEEFTDGAGGNAARGGNANQNFFEAILQRAGQGSAEDMYMLAYLYHDGKSGAPSNRAQALIWYEKAAALGHHDARNWAHFMNSAGDGVPVNKDRALYWRRQEADSVDAGAERDIGGRLLTGDGLARDPAAGIDYLERSAAHGDEYAGQDLIAAYADRASPAYDLVKAQHLLREALVKTANHTFYDNLDLQRKFWAEAGLSKTQINAELGSLFKAVAPTSAKISFWLGSLFQGRDGMLRDDTLALNYFELAAALGDAVAADRAFVLASDKDAASYQPEKALVYLRQLLRQNPDEDFSRYAFEFRRLTRETGVEPAATETELKELLTTAMKSRPMAGYYLGQLLEEGPTRVQESAAILELYRQAATQPPGECQSAAALRLYELYHSGDLVPFDAALATSYLERAADTINQVVRYKSGVALRDGTKPQPVQAFAQFSDLGYYDAARTPMHELMRKAGLTILKSELVHSKDPAALVAMLLRVRFGDSSSELAVWTAEEAIRVTVRFPDYYDEKVDDARSILRHAAENGHPSAYHWLAVSEARFLGPTESALEYAKLGADAGDPACKNLLGLWRWETSQGKDLSCVALLQAAVDGGVQDALFNLARVYEIGEAPLRDEQKARALYARAAEAGISAAKRQLGVMWAEGRGGIQDQTRGLALLREAASDDRGAAYRLGQALLTGEWGQHDAVAGCESLKSALAMGEWRAGIELAWTYHNGAEVPADEVAARRSLQEAGIQAKRDHLEFMLAANQQIGEALWYGSCVAVDPVEAMKWLPPGRETTLAYRLGTGVPQHLHSAEQAARELDAQGDYHSNLELGEIALLQGRAIEARQYFERAAQAGSIRALEKLAKCWADGIGGPASPAAARIFQQAALHATETTATKNL